MAGVEDRVVSMSFENAKFKSAIAETIAALAKMNASLKFDGSKFETGTTKSISAIDKLKAALKLDSGKFKSDTDATSTSLGKLKTSLSSADGKAFQDGTEKSVGVLGRLKSALRLDGGSKGIDAVGTASRRVSFDAMGRGADAVGTKISAMSVVAITALSGITSKAIASGGQLVKSLTIGPISGGLSEYATNLNSVQTILSNTAASGAKLKDVNKALQELNTYSDKTIYNFSQMAKNIGTFTAAGVDLKTATTSIKGIANLAALSGSNSEQASTAMYQLSQAISSGKVGLQDWNSVVNAGMGGTVFQRALAQTAEKMGTLSKGSVELKGKMKNVSIEGQSFRESITAKPGEKSWLTSDVLTSTLKQLSGDMTDAQLKAEGFSDSQIKAIQTQAKMAVNAATQVKTLGGVLDTAKESAGSGWAQTWQIVFGDFGEAKTLFTATSNAINGFISSSAQARNDVLGDWKQLGGRTVLIDGIKKAFEALKSVVEPIKGAFREIFPAKTGQDLFNLTEKFRDFMDQLKIGPLTAVRLQSTFVGLFSIFSIGKQIIGGIFIVIKELFNAVTSGSGGVLEFTGHLGNSLSALNTWLKEGDRLKNFFKGIGQALTSPIRLLGEVKDVLVGLFDGVNDKDANTFQKLLTAVRTEVGRMGGVLNTASAAWDAFSGAISSAWSRLQPLLQNLWDAFKNITAPIVDAIKAQDFDTVIKVIETSLIGGIFLALKKAIKGGVGIDFGGGLLKNLSGAFDTLTGSLKTLQTNVQANTLLQIAVAMGVLAIAVVALSKVDGDDLQKSLTAMAVGFGQLVGAMALITKVSGTAGFAKVPFIAASLILLGVAINVLALAVKQLSGLSWQELAKGLAGVGALLIGISLAVQPLSAGSAKLVLVGAGLIAVGIALNILAGAVKIFATMKWGDMAKGLVGLAAALVAVGVGITLIPPSVLLIGPGLIAVGIALGLIAASVATFGSMDWSTIGKGLVAIAGSLLLIAAATALMPPWLPVIAAGLILVGIALNAIGAAIALMGNLSLGTLAKGIGAIAATLVVLAVGLTAMIASLPGAAALLVAAAALAVLAPVIALLGAMSWGAIFKGLVAIGAALVVIGVAGLVAAPAMLALGIGLLALGAGIVLVGAGVKLLASGLSLLASDGAKGVAVLIAAITGLLLIIPKIAVDFAKGVVAIAKAIAEVAPQIVDAFVKIIISLLDGIIKAAPKLAAAMTGLIQALLQIIRDNFPGFVTTGFDMLMALLQGIDDNIEQVTNKVIDIVEKFVKTVVSRLPLVGGSGGQVLASMMKGISDKFGSVTQTASDILTKITTAVTSGLPRLVSSGTSSITSFLKGVADKFSSVVSSGKDLVSKIVEGVGDKASALISAATGAVKSFANEVGSAASTLVSKGKSLVTEMMSGVSSALGGAVNAVSGQLTSLGSNIVAGIAGGIRGAAGQVVSALGGVVGGAIDAAKKKLHIKSPSRVFMEIGKQTMQGMQIGIEDNGGLINDAMESAIDAMVNSLSKLPTGIEDIIDTDPTIRPVLDLTAIKTGADQMSALLAAGPIDPTTSTGQASAISASQVAQAVADESAPPTAPIEIKFEQHNTSPESLSEVEIYRQTKNQLSMAKDALGVVG